MCALATQRQKDENFLSDQLKGISFLLHRLLPCCDEALLQRGGPSGILSTAVQTAVHCSSGGVVLAQLHQAEPSPHAGEVESQHSVQWEAPLFLLISSPSPNGF